MTVPPHPVRRRSGITELNALFLPLVLLLPAMLAVLAQSTLVVTAPVEFGFGEMTPLRTPRDLPFERTRRVASAQTASVLSSARAQFDAITAADHLGALARQQALRDRPAHAARYDAIRPGETLAQFARRARLRPRDLVALNPEMNLENIRPGAVLRVWRFDPENPPRSVGRPNRGRLRNGEPMPEGPGWIIRDPHHAYGARQTIDALIHAARVVMATHPGGQDLMIADISRHGGGRLPPHRSHQSGRDVDVTYYCRSDQPPTFSRPRLADLDVKRTWTFVRTLLVDHDVDLIFMSRPFQLALYQYAEHLGEHPLFLDRVFEYGPNGHRNSRAVIRFEPGHADHIHVRFACAAEDSRCQGSDYGN